MTPIRVILKITEFNFDLPYDLWLRLYSELLPVIEDNNHPHIKVILNKTGGWEAADVAAFPELLKVSDYTIGFAIRDDKGESIAAVYARSQMITRWQEYADFISNSNSEVIIIDLIMNSILIPDVRGAIN